MAGAGFFYVEQFCSTCLQTAERWGKGESKYIFFKTLHILYMRLFFRRNVSSSLAVYSCADKKRSFGSTQGLLYENFDPSYINNFLYK